MSKEASVSNKQNKDLQRALAGGFLRDDDSDGFEDAVDDPKDNVNGKRPISEEKYEESQADFVTFDEDVTSTLESVTDMRERAKYIPLRLSYEERKSLRLINAAISVSDYTNAVDIEFKSASKRQHSQLQNICGFLSGILAGSNYDYGQEVLADRNFCDYEEIIQTKLEIARRYKIMNPEKMRSEYGKLVYLIQDCESNTIKPLLGASIHKPITTVYSLLESKNGLSLLSDPLLHIATQEILPDKSKSRYDIQSEIKKKEKAINLLSKKYQSHLLTTDDIQTCLYSICDNNSFLNSNRLPILECINLLKKYFQPDNIHKDYSLAISEGYDGARLTHSHELQYNYVLQSLTLWSFIVQDMFRLWYLSEEDLLDCNTNPYELNNTGQGLQRVQQSPRVYKAMHEILYYTQQSLGSWVGSSIIHLGDQNVPNTLVFIDKYTQVSRILTPLIKTLSNLETACEENEGLGRYMQAYGGIEKAKLDILYDFFKHAFDGSGGENFFEAGSCIDGRLTSAWNWCSQLSSKPYYSLFRLTGFLSFDGEFDK
jgi:hypothetical protein